MKTIEERRKRAQAADRPSVKAGPARGAQVGDHGHGELYWCGTAYEACLDLVCEMCWQTIAAGALFTRRSARANSTGGRLGPRLLQICTVCGPVERISPRDHREVEGRAASNWGAWEDLEDRGRRREEAEWAALERTLREDEGAQHAP